MSQDDDESFEESAEEEFEEEIEDDQDGSFEKWLMNDFAFKSL